MHLLLPGPTPIPKPVEQALLAAMTDHRGGAFETVQNRVLNGLAALLGTDSQEHVAVLPASGTGGLEAVVQNLFHPNDRVLVVESGLFGRRFGEVAKAQQLNVDRMELTWGEALRPQAIMERIGAAPYRGVLVTHNETSTGVLNPIEELGGLMNQLPDPPLLVVDSISGVPAIPLTVQNGIDVIVAASQKGFMCPPGLAMIALSDRARSAVLVERAGRFYFDLWPYLKGQLPYTPAISLWYGLDAALQLLQQEGAEARLKRHQWLRNMVRAFGEAGGLEVLVPDHWASPTVTALRLPSSMNPSQFRRHLEQKGLQIAGGLGEWHHRVIRVGHVGAIDVGDLWAGLGLMAPYLPHPQQSLEAAMRVASIADQPRLEREEAL